MLDQEYEWDDNQTILSSQESLQTFSSARRPSSYLIEVERQDRGSQANPEYIYGNFIIFGGEIIHGLGSIK